MRRLVSPCGLLALGVGLSLAFMCGMPASAQTHGSVGTKLPLFTYPGVFGALEVGDEAVAEAGLPLHVIGEGVALIVNGKYLFGPLRIAEYGVNIWPYGGAGVGFSLFQGQFVYSFHVVGGLEYRPENSRWRFFGEFAVAFYGAPFLYSPAEGVFFGMRVVF